MQLAERIFVKENAAMADLCRKQTVVYNQALWYYRQEYFNNDDTGQGFLSYYDLDSKEMLKPTQAYRDAIPRAAEYTIRRMCDAMKAYWAALKLWSKQGKSAGFTGKPKIPGYVSKGEKSPVYMDNQMCAILNGYIEFPKSSAIDRIQTRLPDQKRKEGKMKQVRIIPALAGGYWLELVHNVDEILADVDKDQVMAIDLGMKYIATVVDNIRTQPICYDSTDGKVENGYYHKKIATLKSEKERCTPRMAELQRKKETGLSQDEWIEFRKLLKDTQKMKEVTEKRNRRIAKVFHVLSRRIIDDAVKRRCGTIVVGHNVGQKQNINIGRRANRKFTMLPVFKFIGILTYKAALVGIEVIETEESYTSQRCHRCGTISKKARVYRGLYRCQKCGIEMHSDVNGAYNIMLKARPEALGLNGPGTPLYPVIRNISVS